MSARTRELNINQMVVKRQVVFSGGLALISCLETDQNDARLLSKESV